MIPLNYQKILGHLEKKQVQAELQTETNQIVIVMKIGDREFPIFIRIFDGNELLQMLAFLPCNIKKTAISDTARLLHLLNKELDIPGFGIDEETSVVFYRCMIPVIDKQINEQLFDAYLNSIQLVCKSFSAVVAAVAYGSTTFDEIVKKAKEQNKPLTRS